MDTVAVGTSVTPGRNLMTKMTEPDGAMGLAGWVADRYSARYKK